LKLTLPKRTVSEGREIEIKWRFGIGGLGNRCHYCLMWWVSRVRSDILKEGVEIPSLFFIMHYAYLRLQAPRQRRIRRLRQ
jgi:hypothetical protein